MAEASARPIRLMNFVSEEQLEESKKLRGERLEDGTAQRDRPLYEILKENKDKRDAEFNERFKHRPPKALDEDETEFLDKLEMSRREYERQLADEDAQQLRSFQAAIAAKSNIVHEIKELSPAPPAPPVEQKTLGKKNPAARPLGVIVKVKPQAKKAKVDPQISEDTSDKGMSSDNDGKWPSDLMKHQSGRTEESHNVAISSLVSYSDESDDDI